MRFKTTRTLAAAVALLACVGTARGQKGGSGISGVPSGVGGGVPSGVGGGVPTNVGGGIPTNVGGGVPAGFGGLGNTGSQFGGYPGQFGGYPNQFGGYPNQFGGYPNQFGGYPGLFGGIGYNSAFYSDGIEPIGAIGFGGVGYGVGAYGGYGGYGGYGTYSGFGYGNFVGTTVADQEAIKSQQSEWNATQANLQNAQAAEAYANANLKQQQAMNQAGYNAGPGVNPAGYDPRYNVETGNTRPYPPQLAARHRARGVPALLPREKVLDAEGHILWPEATPRETDLASLRQGVDTAFRDLVADSGKHKRAAVRDAVNARDKLYGFGNQAVQALQGGDQAAAVPEFQVFLASLDRALVSMANAAPRVQSPAPSPDNAPKGAGSVLKDSVKEDRSADTPRINSAAPSPDNAPKGAGSVLKDSIRDEAKSKP